MNNWGTFAGLGLLAATLAAAAYVLYRQRESSTLHRDADLARTLRELAGDDAVRLAAVDEYEIGVYQRLFYSSAIGPRLRSAVWALLGTVLSAAAALALDGLDSAVGVVFWGAALVAAALFAVATVVYFGLAALAAATTPRVSFADSYDADDQ